MLGIFLNQWCQVLPVHYGQDLAGGEIQTTGLLPGLKAFPCTVQQTTGPADAEGGQNRRKSTASVTVFFRFDPGVRVNDRLRIVSRSAGASDRTLVCSGPAYDPAGQAESAFGFAAYFQVDAVETR